MIKFHKWLISTDEIVTLNAKHPNLVPILPMINYNVFLKRTDYYDLWLGTIIHSGWS